MIRVKTGKTLLFIILTLLAVTAQVGFIAINSFGVSDSINYAMYINNYAIGFLIIASLVGKGANKNFLALSFFACYMVFLMGQKPFEPEYDVFLTFARVKLNTEQYYTFSCILFLGLVITYYAYEYFYSKSERRDKIQVSSVLTNYKAMKPVLTVLLAVTLPCALYMQAKIVLVRGGMAYTSGYLINVDVPGIIKAGYYIYSTVVLLFLALKPPKKQLYFVLFTYIIIEGGLQLFQGRRALFASTILFVVWYMYKYNDEEKMKLKYALRIVAILLGLIVLFFVVEQVRDSNSTALSLRLFRRVLVSTGGSDSVIANTIYRKTEFPASGIAYLLNPWLNNPIGNILTGKTSTGQGMAYLNQHNSFSHWISYLTQSSLYLSGHGMGSCYLAETWLAFGVIGVFLVSIVMGWVINKLNSIEFNDNVFRSGLVFFIVRRLFTLPRDGLFSWTSSLIYLVFTYALVYPFYSQSLKMHRSISP